MGKNYESVFQNKHVSWVVEPDGRISGVRNRTGDQTLFADSQGAPVRYQPSATFAITQADNGQVLIFNGVGVGTWSISSGVTLGDRFSIYVENRSVDRRLLRITPVSGTVNGKASLTIPFGASAFINSDGTGDLVASYSAGLGGIVPFSRSSTPMILQSSGTVGANGDLSGITALPEIYSSGAYLRFPGGALFAGSQEGLYWTVMSGLSTGTVYNNRYTSGEPLPPASLKPIVSGSIGAYTQTVGGDVVFYTETLPGGLLNTNSRVSSRFLIRFSTAGGNKTFAMDYGAFTYYQADYAGAATLASGIPEFAMRNALNAQTQMSHNSSIGLSLSTTANTVNGSVDSTQDQTLRFIGRLANAADFLILHGHRTDIYL